MGAKLLGLLLSLCLIALTPIEVSAAAAPKPGTSCSTLKSTKTVNNYKYTCVKNTKNSPKYVWSKGVKVVTKPSPTPTPTTSLSLDKLDVTRVRVVAYNEVQRELAAAGSFVPQITYVLGPSLTDAQKQLEMKGLEATAAFWSSIYKPSSVAISYFNAADVDVIDGLACSLAQYCMATGGKISDMIRGDVGRSNGNSCNSAFATQYSATQQLFAQCVGPGEYQVKNRQTTPHEYTHFAQQANFQMQSPIWFVEGGAAYFGSAIGSAVGAKGLASMDQMVYVDTWGLKEQSLVDMSNVDETSVLKAINRSYKRQPNDGHQMAQLSYYIGSQCTEIMVALWGMPKFKHLMTQISSQGFDDAFKSEYGVNVETFYAAAAKYVVAMYNLKR
ncbi:MAG: Peptidase superfamily [Actinomycetota bacterium]|jgi:hypothetical protein